MLPAHEAVRRVVDLAPVGFVVGGAAAGAYYHKEYADVDLFLPSSMALSAVVAKFLENNYVPAEGYTRRWERWLEDGIDKWHTNSMKLEGPNGLTVDAVYKVVKGKPLTSLAQVLESFDFGLLAVGWTCVDKRRRSMYEFMFPGMDPAGPLPMNPLKERNWVQGYFSRHVGMREAVRYTRYHLRGYDMSLVKGPLARGYAAGAEYFLQGVDEDARWLSAFYAATAEAILSDDFDQMLEFGEALKQKTPLQEIMEGLE